MNDRLPNEIRVEDYPIGTGGDEVEHRIVGIVLNGYEASRKFMQPVADHARMVIRYLKAEYFGPAALAEMEAEDKIPIEISEGWPKFLAELGLAKSAAKVGKPTAQNVDGALDAEGMSILLNTIKTHENVISKSEEAFADNLMTGYPQFTWVEKPANPYSDSIVDVDRDPWDCTLPDANSRKIDYSDAEVVYRIRYPSKDDLLSMFPKRKEKIEEAYKHTSWTSNNMADFGVTMDEREQVFSAIQAAVETTARTGRVHLIQRHALIKKTMDLWTSPDSEKFTALDPDWDDARIEEWKAANPDATKVTGDARIHWVTSVLATGQLLDNRPHWFQDQRFNCEVLNLMMIDGKPVSVLGFAAANWHLAAIAKTEHIHQLRLDNGNPLVMQEGSIVNAQNVEYEVSRPRGKIIVKQGKDVRSAITRLDANRSTQAWSELYAETRETNDRLTVDSNVEGGSQSSQESSKVVMARVNQQSNKYSRIYENANNFYLRLDKLIIRAAQRLIKNDYMVMNWIDPKTQENKQVEVNVPDPNDINTMMGEEPSTFLNRLDLTDYDVVMAEADNSTTGKAAELSEFVQIMQVVGQSVPPEYQGEALSQVPNQICRMIGEQIKQAKQAAQQAPPPPPPKVSATFDMSKLAFNPTMQDAAQQLVGLKPPSPPAPTAPAAQPGMEAPQPQGDMGQSPMPPMDVPAPAGPGVSAPEQPQPGEMNQ